MSVRAIIELGNSPSNPETEELESSENEIFKPVYTALGPSMKLDDPRVCVDRKTGKHMYEDDDGTCYEWDEKKKAWFIYLDEDTLLEHQSVYGTKEGKRNISQMEELPLDFEAKKRRRLMEKKALKAKKLEDKEKNRVTRKTTTVYVTGLPEDTTVDELKELFSKVGGIIMEDMKTGQPSIKLYRGEDGKPKGDASITFFRAESVQLVCTVLDDTEFRDGFKIRVEKATFDHKPNSDKPAKPSKPVKVDKNRMTKVIKKLERRLDWHESEASRKAEKYSAVVALENMFTQDEIDQDPGVIMDIKADLTKECAKFGQVKHVKVYDSSEYGLVTIRFEDSEEAAACIEELNGRWYAQRQLVAYLYDFAKVKAKRGQKDTERDEQERLEKYSQWLESQEIANEDTPAAVSDDDDDD